MMTDRSDVKIAIVGSRSITSPSTFEAGIEEAPDFWLARVDSFVSGGADGVDTLAERYARSNDVPIEVIEPDYTNWAGEHPAKRRNTRIVEAADAVIAIWDGTSNGTRDTIDKALDRGVPTFVWVK